MLREDPKGALAVTGGVAVEAPTTPEQVATAWLLGYSDSTRRTYAPTIREWAAWLQSGRVRPFDAARVHVEAFARALEARGQSRATVARKLATVASFYRYVHAEGLMDRSPVAHVRRPKVSEESPRLGLDREELRALLETARPDDSRPAVKAARDVALVHLLALNGLRISEALAAKVGDLGHERGHRTLAITRKGGKRALVPLAPVTADAIDIYLAGRSEGPLFVTTSGKSMDRQAAWKVVRRLAREAGITKAISPHSLRHSFVTLSLDAGASLRDVQDAAGHASPATTRRYDRGRHSHDRNPTYRLASYVH